MDPITMIIVGIIAECLAGNKVAIGFVCTVLFIMMCYSFG